MLLFWNCILSVLVAFAFVLLTEMVAKTENTSWALRETLLICSLGKFGLPKLHGTSSSYEADVLPAKPGKETCLHTLSYFYCAMIVVCLYNLYAVFTAIHAHLLGMPSLCKILHFPSSSDSSNQLFKVICSTNDNFPAKWLPVNSQYLNKDISDKI